MNRKLIIVAILCLITGACVGAIGMLIAYPFIFPPPVVNEQIMDLANKEIIRSGNFIHPDPSDPAHWGKGDVNVFQHENNLEVFLAKNFEVGPGPAYHVYLSSGTDIINNNDFNQAINFDLGKLKSFESSQVYKVPVDFDLNQVNSVVIWCKTFNQLITSATLIK